MTLLGVARSRVVALVAGAAVLAGSVPAAAAPVAPGDPGDNGGGTTAQRLSNTSARIDKLQGELAAAHKQMEAVNAKAALATEKYNQAKALLAARKAAAEQAKQQADAARLAAQSAKDALNQLAAAIYMQGGSMEELVAFLSPSGPRDLATRLDGAAAASSYRDRTLQDAKAALAKAEELNRLAVIAQLQQQAAAAAAEKAFTEAKAEAEAAAKQTAALEAQQSALLVELAALRASSIEAESRRASAAEMESARKAIEEAMRRSGGRIGSSAVKSAGAAKAIAFARAQLGKPYVWAGEGPDVWDCSGLTQAAWRTAGVSLTHYTGSQWQETSRVSLSDLQPGDLVFYGQAPDAIHHVGLYIGGGIMIEAPRTGLNVRYSPIWRNDLIPYGGRP